MGVHKAELIRFRGILVATATESQAPADTNRGRQLLLDPAS